jgi:hypothetical protein
VDPVDPQVDVVSTRQITVLECLGLVLPLRGQSDDRRGRQSRTRTQELLQRRTEVAAGQAMQIEQRQHLGHLWGLACPRRQDRRRNRCLKARRTLGGCWRPLQTGPVRGSAWRSASGIGLRLRHAQRVGVPSGERRHRLRPGLHRAQPLPADSIRLRLAGACEHRRVSRPFRPAAHHRSARLNSAYPVSDCSGPLRFPRFPWLQHDFICWVHHEAAWPVSREILTRRAQPGRKLVTAATDRPPRPLPHQLRFLRGALLVQSSHGTGIIGQQIRAAVRSASSAQTFCSTYAYAPGQYV